MINPAGTGPTASPATTARSVSHCACVIKGLSQNRAHSNNAAWPWLPIFQPRTFNPRCSLSLLAAVPSREAAASSGRGRESVHDARGPCWLRDRSMDTMGRPRSPGTLEPLAFAENHEPRAERQHPSFVPPNSLGIPPIGRNSRRKSRFKGKIAKNKQN